MDVKVLIADDHELFRAGLAALLEKIPDIRVLGGAGTGEDAIRLCRELKPDVLVLDVDLPDISGFEVTRRIIAEGLPVHILILTMYDLEEYALRLLRLGALGYLIKGASTSELPTAIRTVADGKQYVTPVLKDKIADMVIQQSGADSPLAMLSDRELQILTCVARGDSLKEIAERLGLTFRTVETYYSRVRQKLDLKDSGDVVRFAIKHDILKTI